ncbi:hypothetical protein OH76DRAFT_1414194 [Lentinus brumalis]|uniref:Uncharacterized protein n=1 Tax=Lentinus brumalis TaxID=2498619 RepID=A0A371DVX8_9APHY|nr:hypothetical protein OH76DRAFT_1414194 [Polyporus brumalis]
MPADCSFAQTQDDASLNGPSSDLSAMSIEPDSPEQQIEATSPATDEVATRLAAAPEATRDAPSPETSRTPATNAESAATAAAVDALLHTEAREQRERRRLERQLLSETAGADDDGSQSSPQHYDASPTPAPRAVGAWTNGDPPELCPPEMRRLYGLFARQGKTAPASRNPEGNTEATLDTSKRQWAGSPHPEEVSRAEPRARTAQGEPTQGRRMREQRPESDDDLYFGPPPEGVMYLPRPPAPPADDNRMEVDEAPAPPIQYGGYSTPARVAGSRPVPTSFRSRGMYAGRLYAPLARPSLAPLREERQPAPTEWFADPLTRPWTAAPADSLHGERTRFASTSLPHFDPRQAQGASTPAPHQSEHDTDHSQPEGAPPSPEPYRFTFCPAPPMVPLRTRAETPAAFRQPPPDAHYRTHWTANSEAPDQANAMRQQPPPPRYHPEGAHEYGMEARYEAWARNPSVPPPHAVDYRAFQAAPRLATAAPEADAPALRPSWITTRDDAQPAHTPRPNGGWPEMHRSDPEEPFGGPLGGMPLHRVQEIYEGPRTTTLLIQPFNVGETPTPRVARIITDDIAASILHITGAMPCIVAPEASERGRSNVWIAYGLPESAAAQLLEIEVVSMPAVSYRVFNRDLHMPQLLLTLGSLTGGTQDSLERMVRRNLVGPLRQSIATLVERNPSFAHLTTDEAIQALIDTLRVRILTMNNGNRSANVFMRSPTRSIELWRQWVAQLRAHAWRDREHSTVYARRIALCSCCHSADHPTHLCPFPHIPGWNGPMAGSSSHSSIPPPPPPPGPSSPGPSSSSRNRSSEENARGGPRGRGRGRGRGY